MNELISEIGLLIKENRRKIGPIRKETTPDEEIIPYLSDYAVTVELLIEKADMLVRKSRGQKRETAEEIYSLLEDISSYIENIADEYEKDKSRASLADNLEEVLGMLEDLTYLEDI